MDSKRSSRWLSRPITGVLIILGLVLLLQIPIELIRGVIQDRAKTRDDAAAGIVGLWGGARSIIGPRVVVPYRSPGDHGAPVSVSLLPSSLSGMANLVARPLRRGLFTVPVYTMDLRLRGEFDPTDLAAAGIDEAGLDWDRALLVLELSDPKALAAGASASWQGAAVRLMPGAPGSGQAHPGIHAGITKLGPGSWRFELHLSLRGTGAIWFVPFARKTEISLASDWPHPDFGGAWLPSDRRISDGGFSATWRVPFLGRDYPQVWTSAKDFSDEVRASRFGVTLVSPIDQYRMSERSTKYAALFLVLTFGVFWLFETMTGLRVHPMQYLLVGAAMCTFYLLELSLGEHAGFTTAYMIASGSVVALVGLYARTVLRSTTRGIILAGALTGLYAYLFALLTLEDYALLAGSFGLFVALAGVMYLTRWVDWHRVVRGDHSPVI